MKLSFISIFLFISFFVLDRKAFSQDWDAIDDSVYNHILSSRFNKGNLLIGVGGGNLHFDNDYKVIEFGFQPQIGYLISYRWLPATELGFHFGRVIQDSGKVNTYNRFLFGLKIRRFLRPKTRTFFLEAGPFIGYVSEDGVSSTDFQPYFVNIYGGKVALGLSVFIQRFELEFLVGISVYSQNFKKGNIAFPYILQINLSYIFDRQFKRTIKNK
jgi:hypothetical protein